MTVSKEELHGTANKIAKPRYLANIFFTVFSLSIRDALKTSKTNDGLYAVLITMHK